MSTDYISAGDVAKLIHCLESELDRMGDAGTLVLSAAVRINRGGSHRTRMRRFAPPTEGHGFLLSS